jgi:putative ABC transport system permease protein
MSPADALRAAGQSLRANLLRSTLTSLGIIFGVAAVIMMVAIGSGAEQRIQDLIQRLGSNLLIVYPGALSRGGVRSAAGSLFSLKLKDAEAIEREVPAIEVAAPLLRNSRQLVHGGVNWNARIYGTTPGYFIAHNWDVSDGRALDDADLVGGAKVAVIGKTVQDKLFMGQNPIGQRMRVAHVPFRVVGVAASKGLTPWGSDQDDVVFIPISAAKSRVLGGPFAQQGAVGSISIRVRRAERIDEAIADITSLLRQRHRIRAGAADDFRVRNISAFLEARAQSSRTMTILLASVAAISLLVGGIGIMNIMLVSVTERTREIGLRMATGAKGRDILFQFLIESVALSAIGGRRLHRLRRRLLRPLSGAQGLAPRPDRGAAIRVTPGIAYHFRSRRGAVPV